VEVELKHICTQVDDACDIQSIPKLFAHIPIIFGIYRDIVKMQEWG
jgi:hypothetical protein